MTAEDALQYASSLVPLIVGIIVFFRADAIVDGLEKKYNLSPLNKTDVRFRHARIVFRLVGCVSMAVGIFAVLHKLIGL
ncbi:MAG: hypothetical protein LAN61_01170 [Acidobacteriia bacterium]|nr:hypothetical protein [Terriglobia bacterium]